MGTGKRVLCDHVSVNRTARTHYVKFRENKLRFQLIKESVRAVPQDQEVECLLLVTHDYSHGPEYPASMVRLLIDTETDTA